MIGGLSCVNPSGCDDTQHQPAAWAWRLQPNINSECFSHPVSLLETPNQWHFMSQRSKHMSCCLARNTHILEDCVVCENPYTHRTPSWWSVLCHANIRTHFFFASPGLKVKREHAVNRSLWVVSLYDCLQLWLLCLRSGATADNVKTGRLIQQELARVTLLCEKHCKTSIKCRKCGFEMRDGQGLIALNDGKKRCLIVITKAHQVVFWWICLPKETQYDDGDGQRNERHAVTNGVTNFDGVEEFSLQKKKQKKKQFHRLKIAHLASNLKPQQTEQHGSGGVS